MSLLGCSPEWVSHTLFNLFIRAIQMSDTTSVEMIGTWVALGGFALSYLKEKNDNARALGKLEEKVQNLERGSVHVDNLRNELAGLTNQVIRLESKLDALVALLETQKKV
jgi:hypothetical protein